MHTHLRKLRYDERGFAIVLAVALMALVTTGSLVVYTLTQDENSHSRKDVTKNGAYQAAEAGTNAYLGDLTQDIGFYNTYIAKGEATRTGDLDHAAHPNDCTVSCGDLAWNKISWGTTWQYLTSPATDKGWYTIPVAGATTSQEYQYLIQVYPPNKNLTTQPEAAQITRVDVTGRPYGSTDTSTWVTIETLLRPSSLADFQAFLATTETYGTSAVTTGPIFVGEDNSGTPGNLIHNGTAQANLYAEGTVSGSTTYQYGATHYDKNTNPTALCKLNDCFPVPFTTFTNYISDVANAAVNTGGITLPATDPGNAALKNQTPTAYSVDTWKLVFNPAGTVSVYSCLDQPSTADYTGFTAPTCALSTAISPNPHTTLSPIKFPIYSTTDVIVQGTVHGTVTVASADDIIYGGDTTYVQDGTDVLGLEATNNIYIPAWAIHSAANGNITIYSAQFSLNGGFEADPTTGSTGCSWTGGTNPNGHSSCDSSTQNCNNSPTICLMTINGSSALYDTTQGNGPILMTNAFGHRNYNYDSNLLYLPPPYFPTLPNAFTILTQRVL